MNVIDKTPAFKSYEKIVHGRSAENTWCLPSNLQSLSLTLLFWTAHRNFGSVFRPFQFPYVLQFINLLDQRVDCIAHMITKRVCVYHFFKSSTRLPLFQAHKHSCYQISKTVELDSALLYFTVWSLRGLQSRKAGYKSTELLLPKIYGVPFFISSLCTPIPSTAPSLFINRCWLQLVRNFRKIHTTTLNTSSLILRTMRTEKYQSVEVFSENCTDLP